MLYAVLTLAGLGLIAGIGLVVAARAFAVETDPRIDQLVEILPGANCGACGEAGCTGYANALVKKNVSPTLCAPGGKETAQKIASILGLQVQTLEEKVAVILCAGDPETTKKRYQYQGIKDCSAAAILGGGPFECPSACLSMGTCKRSCPFGAIVETKSKKTVVIPELCTGCGKCVKTCPKGLIKLVPKSIPLHVLCSSFLPPKELRKICKVGCIGCKLCAKEDPIFKIENNLAKIDYSFKEPKEPSSSVAFVCASAAIWDKRYYGAVAWIERKEAFEHFQSTRKQRRKAKKPKVT
jgi:electron transport complex protein RnfB